MTEKIKKISVFGKDVKPMDKYQEDERLRKNIYFGIRQLNSTLNTHNNPQHAQTVEKFLDALIPSKNSNDFGRLPIHSKTFRSPRADKVICVFYIVSNLIQLYWKYIAEDTEKNKLEVANALCALDVINDSYDDMEIKGQDNTGYWLELV